MVNPIMKKMMTASFLLLALLCQYSMASEEKTLKTTDNKKPGSSKISPSKVSPLKASSSKANSPSDYKKRVKARENPATSITYESVKPEDEVKREPRWTDFLPVWGKEAREKGYVLPLPLGISVVGLTQQQPFEVSRIGLAFDGKTSSKIDDALAKSIIAEELEVSDSTVNLRLDAWIFPFWNVYGLYGKTRGNADLKLKIDSSVSTLLLGAAGIGGGPFTPGHQRCTHLELDFSGVEPPVGGSCSINIDEIPVHLDFDGGVAGYGTTIAGGYGDFFGMLDVNYTKADINIALEKSKQTVYSARIGWNGSIGGWNGQLWFGTMKQEIEQTLSIEVPGTKLSAIIDQHVSSPYNYLIGGQWNITEEWSIIAETNFAFGDRQQVMIQAGYRL